LRAGIVGEKTKVDVASILSAVGTDIVLGLFFKLTPVAVVVFWELVLPALGEFA